ncbi:GPR1/FUN34/yaaH family-domain-containing protein [Aspergillus pseudoustus]|uniref:GPR1/FUN34/yaaH family-domain-containing protein n=1 Tax=Aspergillus pseudoustus TaxID=1810923 RepID=A0ABR4IRP9_9EURO
MSSSSDFAHNSPEKQADPDTSASSHHLNRLLTAGGHPNDRSQVPLPVVHRSFANPTPLGLISFAADIFLISVYGLHARGIQSPNVMIGMLVFFGGVCQFLAGIMEFVTGNTFGATVFSSYGAFNLSYALIYLPGSGIMAAYTDPSTGAVSPEFNRALAMYLWVWFIITVLYTVAAMRSTWVLFLDLVALDVCLLLLACGFMVNVPGLLTAGYSFGLVVCFLSFWAGCTGLWAGITPVKLPAFEMTSNV